VAEESRQVGVGYIFEGLDLEDAHIVDQNIDFREAFNRPARSVCGSQISGQTFEFLRSPRFIESSKSFVDACCAAAV
jgi:hypothetical protein